MKLGLLSNHDGHWIAGVLYVQTVLRALSRLPAGERPEMHLLMHRATEDAHYRAFAADVRSTIRYDFIAGAARSQAVRNAFRRLSGRRSFEDCLRRAGIDVLFPCLGAMGPSFRLPWVGWIPDFQHRRLPEMFGAEEREGRDRNHRALVEEAAHLVVSSEDARRDLLRFFGADPARVSVYRFRTHADPDWFEGDPRRTAAELGLPEKFLMFPSQFWKHKNHRTLVAAVARLADSGLDDLCLVLTGKDVDPRHPDHVRDLHEAIARHGADGRIRYLGLLPRTQQIHLLRRACAIVQPSLFEGWSMLVEDCRTLGKTVFLSDIPVHREQAYGAVHYFAPESVDKLASLLAAHWDSLRPGPDPVAEASAQAENARLTLENGHQLRRLFASLA